MHPYLAPWAAAEEDIGWRSPWPEQTHAVLDLRTAAGEGLGLFFLREPVQTTERYLGSDLMRELPASERQALASALDLGEPLVATRLDRILWEILTVHADPTGVDRWSCLMPTRGGRMNLWANGTRIGTRRRIDLDADPEAPNIVARLHANYRAVRAGVEASGGRLPALHRMLLHRWLNDKFRPADGDYERFIPSDLPSETPVKPQTTVSDDFNRADEDLATSADWALLNGSSGSADLVVVSNQVREGFGTSSQMFGQHQTSLSGDDHYSQHTIEALTAPSSTRSYSAASCRLSGNSGKGNAYEYHATVDSGGTERGRLGVWTGTSPSFATLVDQVETISLTDVIRCEADGSDITGKINGTITAGPSTDTALSGDLNVGFSIRVEEGADTDIIIDNFEGGDLGAAPAGGLPAGSLALLGVGM